MLGYVIDANATCYLSNVGKRTVRVKGQRILDSSGAVLTPDATTCGSPEGFDLAPGATCYLGRNTTVSPLACGAFVSNSTFMRGTLEWRKAPTDASYAVGRIELTAKTSSAPVD
ncbi:hypothetical protein [Chenggangzhangella methanolivorans]|uniref:Uncharacterized protein n=2 Tax=Chenggangzhangella methanolivorans TaxID=1437009 RepID=A0A9E6R7M8_9HYPH|nr:hypothetical protein [Chenggangzhangella methanolivorans]QZN98358.1 hypothetical protein K6K41_14690 [Chenggangzhangella methanolivorans]